MTTAEHVRALEARCRALTAALWECRRVVVNELTQCLDEGTEDALMDAQEYRAAMEQADAALEPAGACDD